MRYRRSPASFSPAPASGAGRSTTPGQLLRWVLVFFLLITLTGGMVVSSTSTNDQIRPAAQPTNPAEAVALNKLPIELPRTKAEAQNFERLHHSPYNFEQVNALNAVNATGDNAAIANLEQNPPTAAVTTPGAPRQGTPAAPSSSAQNLTPSPTATEARFPVKSNATGLPTCYTPPPANVQDTCEVDDTPSIATTLIGNDLAQIHNFVITPVGVGTPIPTNDIDWLKFSATANVPYTITVNLRVGTRIPILQLLDNSAATVISTGVTSGTSTVIGNFIPNSSGTFYVKVSPNLGAGFNVNDLYEITLITGTPLATATPTTTIGTGTPSTCRDDYEEDNAPVRAKLLKPSYTDQPPFGGTQTAPAAGDNTAPQKHFICPEGDVDWVYMDLVKGKSYSAFTTGLLGGLDTFIVLYLKDAAGNLVPLYSSDDYPGMGLASRIDWIVPNTPETALGEFVRYYLAVKDVAGHGNDNLSYVLYLSSAGNGLGDCFDQYEPDNNPVQAKEILLNERQNHAFCPTGDRDWVKFYAKAGRSYNIATIFPNSAPPGLDTSLYIWQIIFNSDDPTKIVEQRLIAQNDDPSDTSLAATKDFAVPGDGYYYAEFRNVGDIGRNGMYYIVQFTTSSGASLDIPATQTAGVSASQTAGVGSTITARVGATQTARALTATSTSTSTSTPTATLGSSNIESLLAKMRFADPGFQRLWVYSDLAVAAGRTQRSWEWGPNAAASKLENYVEAVGGTRQVQYFDKSRMEINNPKGDRNSKWFITNGLLVKELVSGWLATGDTQAELHEAAQIAVAGDLNASNKAPSYAAFQNLITQNQANRTADRTGQVVVSNLSKEGAVSTTATPPEKVKLEAYIKETGHNIPSVFWAYLNNKGLVYEGNDYKQAQIRDWVFSMGLPLSEPFWIKAQVSGAEKDVLVQLFERRVLTYTPGNAPEWRVEMSNVGQHYYLWRYNARLE